MEETAKLGWAVRLISSGVAALFILALPLGYFLLLQQHEAASLETEASIYANAIAALEPASQKTAQAPNLGKLRTIIEQERGTDAPETIRILDAENHPILEAGLPVPSPLITKSAEIPGTPAWQIEIIHSLQPLLIKAAGVLALGVLLGAASFALLRKFPLRALALARREIDTRRLTETRLQESLALLGATLESTADGILVADRFGRIVSVNHRFADMWRIPEEVIVSGDHNRLVTEATKQLADPARFLNWLGKLKTLPDSSAAEHEVLNLADGRYFELDSRPQRVGGEILGRVLSVHDITERKRTEDLLAGEKQALEMIVARTPLADVLATVARRIGELSGKMFCSILTRDQNGAMLHMAGPGLPKDYIVAVNRVTATFPEFLPDPPPASTGNPGEAHPALAPYAALAERHGLHLGAAVPVNASNGSLLGMVLGYYHGFDAPAQDDPRLLEIAANLTRIVIERKNAETRLEYLAHYDSLTGLPNRGLFRDRLTQAMSRSDRQRQSLALMFLDLDRFKTINDTLGHDAGDQLLIAVAQRLQGSIRVEDTVARLGGDEFTVVMERVVTPDDAGRVAQKILEALATPFTINDREIFTTASIGVTVYPQDRGNIDDLLKNADTALYNAKEAGRNTFRFYTKEMNEKALEHLNVENDLRHALARGEFMLYYQPKVSLASGKLTGAEALLRWSHPQRGMVQPAEFISLLEDTGMIYEVGRWVLRSTCAQIKAWTAQGLQPMRVAVNVSARQFFHHDLARDVAEALETAGITADQLEIELTESILMQDPERAEQLLQTIQALGIVRIDIDDFGTGYSSLGYLKRFPINTVKIDASFVRDLPDNKEDEAIVLAVIAMARSLGLKVIAEGVENQAQSDFLRLHDCDEVQGYFLSRPLPPEQFLAWAHRNWDQDSGFRIQGAAES